MKNLRGYVIGGIIGGLLVFSGQALADSVSMIGKKVQAENTVILDGQELPVKAINIGGTTFAPIRAFSEAMDKEISFEDSKVIINSTEVSEVNTPEETTIPASTEDIQLSELDKQIAEIERIGTETDNKAIEILTKLSSSIEVIPNREELTAEYERLKEEGKALRKQYDELVAKRAELEAQQ